MTGPQYVRWFTYVSALTVLLVLLQAFMAGRGIFLRPDLLKDHGNLGSVTFVSVLAQALLAFAIGVAGPLRNRLLILNFALVLLMAVQLGLGYSGRDSATAAAWHVPNGVLIFGLVCFNLALALQLPRSSTT
jgi:hypothetical protein